MSTRSARGRLTPTEVSRWPSGATKRSASTGWRLRKPLSLALTCGRQPAICGITDDVAVAPFWPATTPSTRATAPLQRSRPLESSPSGPPARVSVKRLSAVSGRPSSVDCRRPPGPKPTVTGRRREIGPCRSMTSSGSGDAAGLTRITGPSSGAARAGVSALAVPIWALAAHAPWLNWSSGQAWLSVVMTAPSPAGSVIWTVRAFAWPGADSTTVVSVGRPPLAPGSMLALTVGANASLSHPVGVKEPEPEPCVPS
jgi:hypothetical protein